MPFWLLLIVMTLAVYRLTRLVVTDIFPPVLWVRDRLAGGWRPLTEVEKSKEHFRPGDVEEIDGVLHRYVRRIKASPQWLADLLSCVWCAGGWVALVVTFAVDWAVGVPSPLLVWLAVWGAGSLIAAQDWA